MVYIHLEDAEQNKNTSIDKYVVCVWVHSMTSAGRDGPTYATPLQHFAPIRSAER